MSKSLLGTGPTASLAAIVSTFLPELEKPSAGVTIENLLLRPPEASADNKEGNKRFWHYDLSSPNSPFIHQLTLVIKTKINALERIKLLLLLHLLNWTVGTFFIFRSSKFLLRMKPFTKWPLSDRIIALQWMRDSNIESMRGAFSGLKRLICALALTFTLEEENESKAPNELNPFWEAMGYPGPIHRDARKDKDELLQHISGHGPFTSKSNLDTHPFISPPSNFGDNLNFDFVIIGSGAGGSVAANNLAQAGYSVLILEKGSYIPPNEISNLEAEALDKLYEQHGMVTTSDGNIMILAGSTVGGGTTVNWGCCLDTPDYVRREWESFGLEQFRPGRRDSDFDKSLNFVKERIGCKNEPGISVSRRNQLAVEQGECPPHNVTNTLFCNGCDALKYRVEETGNNFKHPDWDSAGYTCFGDRYGNKKGTLVTFLSDAVETGNAKIIQNCTVDRILTKSCGPLARNKNRKKRAHGVRARVEDKLFEVNANKGVICSAGSLNTPCLLLNSEMKNRHIGRHLKLHPVIPCTGVFHGHKNAREQTKRNASQKALEELPRPLSTSMGDGNVRCYLKAPMTTVCTEFQNLNGGYGPRIECPSLHAGLYAAGTPWLDPLNFKSKLLHLKNSVPLIVLQRDRGEGRVTCNCKGLPKISYELDKNDKKSMVTGLLHALKILEKSGSDYVSTAHNDDTGIVCDNDEHSFSTYLNEVEKRGIEKHKIGVFSAHQMGSCRMGTSAETSVVDQNGESWECKDLYIMDASIFPSASGANPMITTLTLSHMLSLRLKNKLQD